jgi:hypothetical protein
MLRQREWLERFLFPHDSGRWVLVLQVGLGLQIACYSWSLRDDWVSLFSAARTGLINRALAEAVLSGERSFTPRLGWVINTLRMAGVTEETALWMLWLLLLGTGLFLLTGFYSRIAAIVAWFLFLCVAKSGTLFSYGVDNLTIIGLFYLMIAPAPQGFSLGMTRKHRAAVSPERYGFHRRVLQLHLSIIYFFAGISKALALEWWNGVSAWKALTRPPFDLIPPDLLIRFAPLLPIAGIVVLLIETCYPVFIWSQRTRPFWLGAILLMHSFIGLTMGLYLFALIMIVLNLAAFGPGLFSNRAPVSIRPAPVSSA